MCPPICVRPAELGCRARGELRADTRNMHLRSIDWQSSGVEITTRKYGIHREGSNKHMNGILR